MINTFCQEITGEKKSSFNFEKELKNPYLKSDLLETLPVQE